VMTGRETVSPHATWYDTRSAHFRMSPCAGSNAPGKGFQAGQCNAAFCVNNRTLLALVAAGSFD
jgi:hypothetical protein